MNKIGLFTIVLAAASACAQDANQQPQSATQPTTPQTSAAKPAQPQVARSNAVDVSKLPTANDMYCSGLVLKDAPARAGRVVGGWDSPFQTRYVSDANLNGVVYLDNGNFAKDQEFAIIRPIKDPNEYEMTPGQKKALKAAGQFYMEVGRIKIFDVQKGIGMARAEFTCDGIVLGDIATPWGDRPVPEYRADTPWDFFAQPNGKTTGALLMGREYDGFAAQRGKVYINIGTNQGVKAGDYFRVTRTYTQMAKDPSDRQSIQASMQDYRMVSPLPDPIEFRDKSKRYELYPRKSIGELMVLYATPTTATATVTRSWEQLQPGDTVELMEEPPPPPPAPAAAAMNPPTVTCTATPASVHVGETATIRCSGASPDNRELTYNFASDNGAVTGRGETAVLNTANAQPGVATVTTTVSDDRGQTGTTTTQVNIQAAAAPEATNAGALAFKPSSAYVNNQAKAILDQVALRLQREPGSQAMMLGHVAEKESARLAIARATNAKNYLVKDKGIDAARIQVADGGPGAGTVEVWFVPAGAAMPNPTPQAPPQQ
jgi:outer membrane protein OmpA-like peptidoglycan-associated protein